MNVIVYAREKGAQHGAIRKFSVENAASFAEAIELAKKQDGVIRALALVPKENA